MVVDLYKIKHTKNCNRDLFSIVEGNYDAPKPDLCVSLESGFFYGSLHCGPTLATHSTLENELFLIEGAAGTQLVGSHFGKYSPSRFSFCEMLGHPPN